MFLRPTIQGRERADGGVSSPWGPRDIGFHHGEDYYWLTGNREASRRLYGVATGRVISVWYSNSMGWETTVEIKSDLRVRYCHTDEPWVSVGETIGTGTIIALMGATGTEARGEMHLHFEVWVYTPAGWTRTDPAPYFSGITPTVRKKKMSDWQMYTRASDGAAIAIGWSNPLDPILRRAWFEYPPSGWVEKDLYAPIALDNATWNHRSDARDRLKSIGEVNAALRAAGRPELTSWGQLAAPGGGSGGNVTVDLQPVLDAVAKVPAETRSEFSKNPLK